MEIVPFTPAEVPAFLALATAEGWVCDPWEFSFLLGTFPRGCLAGMIDGRPVAFVTALKHGTGGWVGNLIVAPGSRGKGAGPGLMARALAALQAAGADTVWLTASEAGRPIYEKMGFREIDVITRWTGEGRGTGEVTPAPAGPDALAAADRAGWGDDRSALLAAVAQRGMVLTSPGGSLVLQPCAGSIQIGPWGGAPPDGAAELLQQARATVPAGTRIVLDAPVRNIAAARIFAAAGFTVCGRNSLMFAGITPAYRPELIYALASMGSMG